MPRVILYGRPDCHLCDEARDALGQMRSDGADLDLVEVDIESDEGLLRRYLERIPVVEIGGEVVSELALDLDAVKARLDTVST
jgi:glutaredoxin